ncbi:hypothetical protein CANARDRAFT_30535 [[Candida] arabinofermentans NRRL YB-2248]|uniref:2-dehydropantolactone reductase n=1 Tax=[Candida] arabinofermentans NRRL YB-2248 TaxID=983967 RepID=A0A1E4STG8_9ASCO|nr:hypothetical protein CANARDRAFT_30535 [[Candida] arabinofermentans NRRL YB-2248]
MSTPTINTKTFTLNNGELIPAVALGCWRATPEDTYNSVLAAIKAGYRHIDTAHAYLNEEAVGKAIKDCGVPRDELFITTKLWNTFHRDVEGALNGSLARLGLDYVDLYLVHWPVPMHPAKTPEADQIFVFKEGTNDFDVDFDWDYSKTWSAMEDLVLDGKKRVKSIGVSNLSKKRLETLLNNPNTRIIPACNQVEMHPYCPQHELVAYCKEKGILIEGYSPLGSAGSPLIQDEVIVKLATKLGVSPATLLISWGLARDYVVLPKSVTVSRIESNLKTIELDDATVDEINNLWKLRGVTRAVNRDWKIDVYNDDDPSGKVIKK